MRIIIIISTVLHVTALFMAMLSSMSLRVTHKCCHALVVQQQQQHQQKHTATVFGHLFNRRHRHRHHNQGRHSFATPTRGLVIGRGGDIPGSSPAITKNDNSNNNSNVFAASSTTISGADIRYIHSATTNNRRMKFAPSPSSSSTSTSTSLFSTAIADLEKEAASNSKFISGSTPVLKDFGGIPYRETFSSDQQDESFRVVFILGGPGAGKGTQSEYLLENYPCVHLSAGELLREEAKKTDTSPHAALISECLVEGKIVPVEISLTLLQNAMRETNSKSTIFLIDGFPRNFDNLDGWTRCMTDVADVWGVLYYQCPLSILEKRVMERSKESGRSDDNLDSLRRRFKTFEGETVPVINTLRRVQEEQGSLLKVVDIAGDQSKEQVWEETQKTMNSFLANDILSSNARLLESITADDVDTYMSLCADELFDDDRDGLSSTPPSREAAIGVMRSQEGKEGQFKSADAKCAQMTFISGTKVSVSYDRTLDGEDGDEQDGKGLIFRETRIWSHQGPKGWRMVYFFRSPSC